MNKFKTWSFLQMAKTRIFLHTVHRKGKNVWFLLTHGLIIFILYSVLLWVIGAETPYANFLGHIVHAYIYGATFVFIRRQLWPNIDITVELVERKNMSVAVFFAALFIGLAIIFTGL